MKKIKIDFGKIDSITFAWYLLLVFILVAFLINIFAATLEHKTELAILDNPQVIREIYAGMNENGKKVYYIVYLDKDTYRSIQVSEDTYFKLMEKEK